MSHLLSEQVYDDAKCTATKPADSEQQPCYLAECDASSACQVAVNVKSTWGGNYRLSELSIKTTSTVSQYSLSFATGGTVLTQAWCGNIAADGSSGSATLKYADFQVCYLSNRELCLLRA